MEFLVLALFPRSDRILAKLPTLRTSGFFNFSLLINYAFGFELPALPFLIL